MGTDDSRPPVDGWDGRAVGHEEQSRFVALIERARKARAEARELTAWSRELKEQGFSPER